MLIYTGLEWFESID